MEKTNNIYNNDLYKHKRISINLIEKIIDYIPIQYKFQIIQNFKLNEKLLNSLNAIFLESNSVCKFNYRKKNLKTLYYTTENEEEYYMDENLSETPFLVFISPKFIFQYDEKDSINKEVYEFLYDITKKVLRNANKQIKNLKYYPVSISSYANNNCITNVARKNSNLFSYDENNKNEGLWLSQNSTFEKPEFVVLKIHPNLSFVTGITLDFINKDKFNNCKFVQVSFGFNQNEFYFKSGKIPIEIIDQTFEISFNTAFLANYVKIEFIEKIILENKHNQDNYYVGLENLKINGVSMKNLSKHKKILYQKFFKMQPAPEDIWETYIENLLFLDKEKFSKTEIYNIKLKELEERFNLIFPIQKEEFCEFFPFFCFNHKILKHSNHAKKIKQHYFRLLYLAQMSECIRDHLWGKEICNFDMYPIFSCFRKS